MHLFIIYLQVPVRHRINYKHRFHSLHDESKVRQRFWLTVQQCTKTSSSIQLLSPLYTRSLPPSSFRLQLFFIPSNSSTQMDASEYTPKATSASDPSSTISKSNPWHPPAIHEAIEYPPSEFSDKWHYDSPFQTVAHPQGIHTTISPMPTYQLAHHVHDPPPSLEASNPTFRRECCVGLWVREHSIQSRQFWHHSLHPIGDSLVWYHGGWRVWSGSISLPGIDPRWSGLLFVRRSSLWQLVSCKAGSIIVVWRRVWRDDC